MSAFDLDAGTRELYGDPRYYDSVYGCRTADVRFYGQRYLEADGLVLELAVGTGRIAAPAVTRGARVLGLDLSLAMLTRARSRAPGLHLVRADMRAFAFARRFPLISAPFNALQHLYTDDDLARCLACVRAHLADGGRFIFDVYLPDPEYQARDPHTWFEYPPYRHPTHGAVYSYAERNHFDPATRINQMWCRSVRAPGQTAGPAVIEAQLSQRYFLPEEIALLLGAHGLRLERAFGDFDGGSLGATSESLIGIARRA